MKKRALLVLLSMVTFLACGCGKQENVPNSPKAETGETATKDSTNTSEQVVFDGTIETSDTDMFTDRDYRVEYEEAEAVLIQLKGDSATCNSEAVQILGNTVTLQEEGTYVLRGNLEDGMIIVDAEKTDKLQLVLDGVSINSETSAPVYILQADKVFVTLTEGTTNVLSNGGNFEAIDENNIDAVIFSKDDLTLNGLGSLQVISPAGHGIISKDDLVITSGAYTIECASHGLDANNSVRLINAAMSIDSGKDGIHAENSDDAHLGYVYVESGTYHISAEGDGISAGAYLQVEDGSFDILAGGGSENAAKQHSDEWGMFGGGGRGGHGPGQMPGQGTGQGSGQMPGKGTGQEPGQMPGQGTNQAPDDFSSVVEQEGDGEESTSMKAMKAAGNLTINGGSFVLNSADDAVHSNASVTVNGGVYEIATGDDAFHADETLTVTAGTVNITESYEGLEGLHVDISGGDIKLAASDDGLNAAGGTDQSGMGGPRGNDKFGGPFGSSSNGSVEISGGSLYVNASGDGIDANGYLEITGGNTVICGPTRGDTAVLDYDSSATITGGTFIGTGAIQMAQTFSDAEQGIIAINAGNQVAGSQIVLTDKNGETVVTYEPTLDFSLLIFSSPDIVTGETYTVTIGDVSGEIEAD